MNGKIEANKHFRVCLHAHTQANWTCLFAALLLPLINLVFSIVILSANAKIQSFHCKCIIVITYIHIAPDVQEVTK